MPGHKGSCPDSSLAWYPCLLAMLFFCSSRCSMHGTMAQLLSSSPQCLSHWLMSSAHSTCLQRASCHSLPHIREVMTVHRNNYKSPFLHCIKCRCSALLTLFLLVTVLVLSSSSNVYATETAANYNLSGTTSLPATSTSLRTLPIHWRCCKGKLILTDEKDNRILQHSCCHHYLTSLRKHWKLCSQYLWRLFRNRCKRCHFCNR